MGRWGVDADEGAEYRIQTADRLTLGLRRDRRKGLKREPLSLHETPPAPERRETTARAIRDATATRSIVDVMRKALFKDPNLAIDELVELLERKTGRGVSTNLASSVKAHFLGALMFLHERDLDLEDVSKCLRRSKRYSRRPQKA